MQTNYGYNSSDFVDVGSSLCANLKKSSQGLSQYIRGPSGTIYYVSSGQKHAFTSYDAFQSASYCNHTCTYTPVSGFLVGTIPDGSNIN